MISRTARLAVILFLLGNAVFLLWAWRTLSNDVFLLIVLIGTTLITFLEPVVGKGKPTLVLRELKRREQIHQLLIALGVATSVLVLMWVTTRALGRSLGVALLSFAGVVTVLVLRRIRVMPHASETGLVGKEATVLRRCAPRGQVQLGSEIWGAEAPPGVVLETGERVQVTAAVGLLLHVAKKPDP
jgi:membrane protein implicated in regulation of membrane protease activity